MMPSESLKTWLGKTARRYNEALTPEVLSYLEERALDPDVVSTSLLGLVSDPDPLHETYRDRLSIPFITPTGVVYMRFRCIAEIEDPRHSCKEYGHGKYEGPSEQGTHLYNVAALHEADTVVAVTEGELDALVSSDAGLPGVGVPGSQNWKSFYYRLFSDFSRVVILGDGDKAGRDFTNKLASHISGGEAKVLPPGQDVTSFVVEHGKESFLEFALS